jgi:hypothetical protein
MHASLLALRREAPSLDFEQFTSHFSLFTSHFSHTSHTLTLPLHPFTNLQLSNARITTCATKRSAQFRLRTTLFSLLTHSLLTSHNSHTHFTTLPSHHSTTPPLHNSAMHASLRALQREAPNLDVSAFLFSPASKGFSKDKKTEYQDKLQSKSTSKSAKSVKAIQNNPKIDPFIAKINGESSSAAQGGGGANGIKDAKDAISREGSSSILGLYSFYLQEAAKHFSHLEYTKAWQVDLFVHMNCL